MSAFNQGLFAFSFNYTCGECYRVRQGRRGHADMTGGCMFALLSKGNSIRARACWTKAPICSHTRNGNAWPQSSQWLWRGFARLHQLHLKPCLHYNVCQLAPKKMLEFWVGQPCSHCSPTQQSEGNHTKVGTAGNHANVWAETVLSNCLALSKMIPMTKDFKISRPFI